MFKRAFTPSAAALAAVLISCGTVQAMPITTIAAPPPTIQTSSTNNVQLAQWGHRYYWHGNHGWRRAHWRNGYWGGGPGWRRAHWYGGPVPYAYGPRYYAYGPRYGYWHDNYWHNDASFILPGLILLGAGIGLGAAIF